MKNIVYKKYVVLGTIILLFGTTISAGNSAIIGTGQSHVETITKNDILLDSQDNYISSQETSGTEYWALIFAVGIYKNNPQQNRLSMLEAADDLYDVLLSSSQWQADHIRKVTGSECLLPRLLQELNWLAQNADEDDMVIVYITTHGNSLKDDDGNPYDIPPEDEADGSDEILAMHDGFDKKLGFIWDDLLNFYLNRIKSYGLCLIVDSCYAGGFNDFSTVVSNSNSVPTSQEITGNTYNKVNTVISSTKTTMGTLDPRLITTTLNKKVNPTADESKGNTVTNKINDLKAYLFTQGLIEDVRGHGRVILMSCEEDSLSWGSDFSFFLIDGFWGSADFFGNGDGINSAEESFDYADWWVYFLSFGRQNPTISDYFPGEFTVTYV